MEIIRIEGLNASALWMREKAIGWAQNNATYYKDSVGSSAGWNGDGLRTGGALPDVNGGCGFGCKFSIGGNQLSPDRSIFGIPYGKDGVVNYVVEAFGGPHDFFDGPLYNRNKGYNSEAQGGKFADGFRTQFGFSLASASYQSVAGASALSRQASDTNVTNKMMTTEQAAKYVQGSASPGFFNEAGTLSNLMNNVPFVRATGWFHDWTTGTSPVGYSSQYIAGIGNVVPRIASNVSLANFVNTPILGDIYNVGTMLPSYLVTVGAVIDESGATAYLPPR